MSTRAARFALLTAILLAGASRGQETPVPPPAAPFSGLPAAETGAKWALIICGIPGDAEHHELYSQSVESLHESLTKGLGFPADNVRVQFGAERHGLRFSNALLDLPLVTHQDDDSGLELTDRFIKLADLRGKKPVVLIFGSFT